MCAIPCLTVHWLHSHLRVYFFRVLCIISQPYFACSIFLFLLSVIVPPWSFPRSMFPCPCSHVFILTISSRFWHRSATAAAWFRGRELGRGGVSMALRDAAINKMHFRFSTRFPRQIICLPCSQFLAVFFSFHAILIFFCSISATLNRRQLSSTSMPSGRSRGLSTSSQGHTPCAVTFGRVKSGQRRHQPNGRNPAECHSLGFLIQLH